MKILIWGYDVITKTGQKDCDKAWEKNEVRRERCFYTFYLNVLGFTLWGKSGNKGVKQTHLLHEVVRMAVV